ncbi:hypothetical protein FSARC_12537 [Fusarium sarcochroum]|uniref:Heterokaryon incompatibility domain-containing protein n=1 Tax=Fusarium sarcochroum TaxID=1208366 RepID=A0A8H4T7X0_9HYPO|nr:hypothetical protein FSARC_12537 [Fusarium sarcochroum]
MPYPLAYALRPSEISDDQESPHEKSIRDFLQRPLAIHPFRANDATSANSSIIEHGNRPDFDSEGKQSDNPSVKFQFGYDYDRASEANLLHDTLEEGLDVDTCYSMGEIKPPSERGGGIRATWDFWNTPLHRALIQWDFKASNLLFQHGANVNILNERGKTPLHVAIGFNRSDVVKYLIYKRARLNELAIRTAFDEEGQRVEGLWHPLHLTLLTGNMAIMRILVEAGSDVNHIADCCWSILDLALLAGDRPAVSTLVDAGAKLSSSAFFQDYQNDPAILMAEARSLSSSTTTSTLVPQRSFWRVYRHMLALSNMLVYPQQDYRFLQTSIDTFFEKLYEIANVEGVEPNHTLCNSCLDHPVFKLHTNEQELHDCGKGGCYFCARVASKLEKPSWEPSNSSRGRSGKLWKPLEDNPPDSGVYISLRVDPTSPGPGMMSPELIASSVEASVDCAQGLGSRITLNTAKIWLEDCKLNHDSYQRSFKASAQMQELPRRLIYVGDDLRDPFLEDQVNSQMEWCALSYCWGPSINSASTTTSSIATRLQRIDLTTLPNIIKQAILTTRALGCNYIWVDAVCIIQDDNDDCEREAAKMHIVYDKAQVTISSLVANQDGVDPQPLEVCFHGDFTTMPQRPLSLHFDQSHLTLYNEPPRIAAPPPPGVMVDLGRIDVLADEDDPEYLSLLEDQIQREYAEACASILCPIIFFNQFFYPTIGGSVELVLGKGAVLDKSLNATDHLLTNVSRRIWDEKFHPYLTRDQEHAANQRWLDDRLEFAGVTRNQTRRIRKNLVDLVSLTEDFLRTLRFDVFSGWLETIAFAIGQVAGNLALDIDWTPEDDLFIGYNNTSAWIPRKSFPKEIPPGIRRVLDLYRVFISDRKVKFLDTSCTLLLDYKSTNLTSAPPDQNVCFSHTTVEAMMEHLAAWAFSVRDVDVITNNYTALADHLKTLAQIKDVMEQAIQVGETMDRAETRVPVPVPTGVKPLSPTFDLTVPHYDTHYHQYSRWAFSAARDGDTQGTYNSKFIEQLKVQSHRRAEWTSADSTEMQKWLALR